MVLEQIRAMGIIVPECQIVESAKTKMSASAPQPPSLSELSQSEIEAMIINESRNRNMVSVFIVDVLIKFKKHRLMFWVWHICRKK